MPMIERGLMRQDEMFHWVLDHDEMRDAIVLVFVNKMDLPNGTNNYNKQINSSWSNLLQPSQLTYPPEGCS